MSSDDPSPKPKIACLPNGPYYLLYDLDPAPVPYLRKWNGQACANIKGAALCRCGGSKNKPFCDGTHSINGFSDKKLTDGSANKRVDYPGRAITIHDNRGICSHAGFCTDNLKRVFRMGEEPWIDPDGATAEEIIRVVRMCPSGALSYSVGRRGASGSGPRAYGHRHPQRTVCSHGRHRAASAKSSARALRGSTTPFAAAGPQRTSRFVTAAIGRWGSRTSERGCVGIRANLTQVLEKQRL